MSHIYKESFTLECWEYLKKKNRLIELQIQEAKLLSVPMKMSSQKKL